MSLSVGEQTEIVLRFLRGAAVPHVRTELARYGFDQDAYDRGWDLLRQAAEVSLVQDRGLPREAEELGEVIFAWKKRWLPIINATLAAHFPEIDLRLLPVVTGERRQSPLNVKELLEKLEALRADTKGKAAMALLERRGLTARVLEEARDLLAKEQKALFGADRHPERVERRDQASAALWTWYLEWSAIARAAIKDHGTLRLLGFRRGKPREAEAAVE